MTTTSNEIYSFNDIVMATWESLAGKTFMRSDNNELLGSVYAKYDNRFSLSAILTNGRIEFLNEDRTNVKRVFGEELDVNAKLFTVTA